MAPPTLCYRKPTLLTLSCRLYSIIARLNFDICTDFPNHSAFYCLPEEFRGIPEVDFHVGNVMVFMWYRAHYSVNTGLKMFLMVVNWNWYHIACILAVLTAWSLPICKMDVRTSNVQLNIANAMKTCSCLIVPCTRHYVATDWKTCSATFNVNLVWHNPNSG